jgi:spermidine synthase
VPPVFVLSAAALVGFAFFLMEMVWFRMLGPLLGGTVFTFGLILAIALLGIAVGGAAYGILARDRPATANAFITTTLLEALSMVVPLALGNRLAILTIYLQPLRSLGFPPQLFGWGVVALITVFSAAVVAGYQFPLLIALLGKGREEVGRQVGLAYAWNTVGAIVGSLAGGFGLLPMLTAPGCWRLTAVLLALLGLATLAFARLRSSVTAWLLSGAGAAGVLALAFFARGPTATWRHIPIGVGRVPPELVSSPRRVKELTRSVDRGAFWQAEGVESAVALDRRLGLALIVNGKSDGAAISDSPTMVMSALLAPLLYPSIRRGMVIGLGTGTTAGWLAALPQVERVDVVELEPAVIRAAELFKPVTRDALHQPKVRLSTGDAREVLLSTPERYDLVFSEPSNPYRAGVASLFTQEYYRAIRARLNAGGVFCQWVQAYDVDRDTIRTVYSTLSSVFPHVESWQLHVADILLVASERPVPIDLALLRKRMQEPVFRDGLRATWRATDAEGVLARYIGGARTTAAIAESADGALNTDDRTLVEFAFARALTDDTFVLEEVREVARALRNDRPMVMDGTPDWDQVERERANIYASLGYPPLISPRLPPALRELILPTLSYVQGHNASALQAWEARHYAPANSTERLLMAEGLAEKGDERALPLIEAIRAEQPIEADMLLARLKLRQERLPEAAELLRSAFIRYRTDPWVSLPVVKGALALAQQLAHKGPGWASMMLAVLREPFVVYSQDEKRVEMSLELAAALPLDRSCVDLLQPLEPNTPWNLPSLRFRARCYRQFNPVLADLAERELLEFDATMPQDLLTQLSTSR